MAIIKITRGLETIVDDDLHEKLNQFKWYAAASDGRPMRRVDKRTVIGIYHQVLGVFPWQLNGRVIDHINRNVLDNRRENLRVTSQTENMRNSITAINGKGISVDRTHGTYKVYIGSGWRRVNIGTFKTKSEAETARTAFLRKED